MRTAAIASPQPRLALVLAAAQRLYPGGSRKALKGRLRLLASWLRFRGRLGTFFREPAHQALAKELSERPELLGFMLWPYIHAGWPTMTRFEALAQHQQAIATDMAALAVPPDGSLLIADLADVSPGMQLVVDRAPWCLREGSLVFNQFLHDERMMSLAFSFGWRDGERVAYIGSVQGSNVDSALAKYRDMAKGLQGMRSRDFLIKMFQLLTNHMGVKQLFGVSDEQRHHRHPYFGTAKAERLHLDYNEIWEEHSAERLPDGFYRLPSLPVVKAMEEIAAKNRALYRRRYALMDRLSSDLASRFAVRSPAEAHAIPE